MGVRPSRLLAVDIGIALLVLAAMTMPFVVPRPPELEPATWPAYGLTTLTVVPLTPTPGSGPRAWRPSGPRRANGRGSHGRCTTSSRTR